MRTEFGMIRTEFGTITAQSCTEFHTIIAERKRIMVRISLIRDDFKKKKQQHAYYDPHFICSRNC